MSVTDESATGATAAPVPTTSVVPTETVPTESLESTVTETVPTEPTPVVALRMLSEYDMVAQSLIGLLDDYAGHVYKAQAIIKAKESSDPTAILESLRSGHPLYAQVLELLEKIDAENADKVSIPTDAEYETAKTSLAEFMKKGASGLQVIMDAYPGDNDILVYAPSVFTEKARKSTKEPGAAPTYRPQLEKAFVTYNGTAKEFSKKNADNKYKPSFTALANFLSSVSERGISITTAELQEKAFEVAGTTKLSDRAGAEIAFNVTMGANTFTVTVVPA